MRGCQRELSLERRRSGWWGGRPRPGATLQSQPAGQPAECGEQAAGAPGGRRHAAAHPAPGRHAGRRAQPGDAAARWPMRARSPTTWSRCTWRPTRSRRTWRSWRRSGRSGCRTCRWSWWTRPTARCCGHCCLHRRAAPATAGPDLDRADPGVRLVALVGASAAQPVGAAAERRRCCSARALSSPACRIISRGGRAPNCAGACPTLDGRRPAQAARPCRARPMPSPQTARWLCFRCLVCGTRRPLPGPGCAAVATPASAEAARRAVYGGAPLARPLTSPRPRFPLQHGNWIPA